MGHSLKLFGKGFAEALIETTTNPFVGLLIGILATSIIQSSSTTTALTVGLVAGDALTLATAIPIIMGANIGTTITNTLVSMAHITRKNEFQRAFAGATVHDFFNILAVLLLFPLEITFHFIEKTALFFSNAFVGVGGVKFISPLKLITEPAIRLFDLVFSNPIPILIIAVFLMFFSLIYIVKIMKLIIVERVENFFDDIIFRNAATAMTFGMLLTAAVQSSSVSTSLIIPLVGAGILTIRQVFPYTLGANIGTTITAMLAAFATANPVAITVAFSHLIFNIFGIVIFYPIRELPIRLAEGFAKIAVKSKKHTVGFVIGYYMLYIIPLVFLLIK